MNILDVIEHSIDQPVADDGTPKCQDILIDETAEADQLKLE
jgi:hypothetical protein